jgi:uncharacterized OB-fold protein
MYHHAMPESAPVNPTLFVRADGDGIQLSARKCQACGAVTFPAPTGCPRCTSEDLVSHGLPAVGELFTWTVQRFEPKPPFRSDGFQPYGVGYVRFPEAMVEGRLTICEPEQLEIGAAMRVVEVPAFTDDDGVVRTTFAFEPAR